MLLAEKRNASQPQEWKREARKKRTALRYFRVALLVAFCFGYGLFYTSRCAELVSLGYRVARMQQELSALQSENKRLELKLAELQDPRRIERVAVAKLGMRAPEEVVVAPLGAARARQEGKEGTEQGTLEEREFLLATAYRLLGRAEAAAR